MNGRALTHKNHILQVMWELTALDAMADIAMTVNQTKPYFKPALELVIGILIRLLGDIPM
jgi:hypothetical protein